ncbi:MAG: hypothetical protein Pg6B_07370 [Candidatus Azobacteroides pseudotrichonymphae]|jgi:hypothetical protein|nr:MAG: hypothetical protein Pg6B_07370 [Candidatus Azobacteroides pseudotrichonymphae]
MKIFTFIEFKNYFELYSDMLLVTLKLPSALQVVKVMLLYKKAQVNQIF